MMLQIEKEWKWELEEAQTRVWMRECLVWRGIVLACVEGSGDRWFGNLGDGAHISDWQSRVAHAESREICKKAITDTLLKRLQDGLK